MVCTQPAHMCVCASVLDHLSSQELHVADSLQEVKVVYGIFYMY